MLLLRMLLMLMLVLLLLLLWDLPWLDRARRVLLLGLRLEPARVRHWQLGLICRHTAIRCAAGRVMSCSWAGRVGRWRGGQR